MKVTICIGSSCHLKGSREIVMELQKLVREHKLEDKVELNGSFCMGQCKQGVNVRINDEEESFSVQSDKVKDFFEKEILGRL